MKEAMNLTMTITTMKVKQLSAANPVISHSCAAMRAMAVLAVVILSSAVARAQADFEKGYQAFQSYHGSDFDTVNLANGNLVLNIPLLSYEQRGGVPPVTISIRSNSTTFQSTPPLVSGPADTNQHEVASGVIGAPWGQPHVMISPGGLFWKEERIVTSAKTAIGPEYLVRFVAIDDSGATHSLGGSIANATAGYVAGIKYSVDGSGLMLQPGTSATGPVLVDRKGNTGGLIDPNGNAIVPKGTCATAPGSGDFFNPSLPSWQGYAHGTASATQITDTIGRLISNPSYLPPLQSYSCLVDIDASYHPAAATPDPGVGNGGVCHIFPAGSPLTYEESNYNPEYFADSYTFPGEDHVGVPLTFCYAQIPVSASIPQVNGASLSSETINEKWWALTSVTLPNGTFWQFGYDNYGQVETVIMPTGGMVTYQYATRLACGNPPGQIPVVGTPIWPYSNLLSSRMVTQRNVYINSTDAQPTEIWTYSNNIGSGWMGAPPAGTDGILSPGGANQGTVSVTDPLGNVTTHTFSLIGGSTCGPYETKTKYYQGQSTPLKEVDTTYSNTGTDYANPTNFSNYIALGVFPSTVSTTLATSTSPLVSQDTYLYDKFGSYEDYTGITHGFSFGQVLSSTEYDWGGAAPLRTTLHTKLWQSNLNYYAANLIDLPCLDTVYFGSFAGVSQTNPQPSCTPPTVATNQIAQTQYQYDQQPTYSSCSTAAGNSTSVIRWLNGGNSVITHTYYGSASGTRPAAVCGMPQAKADAIGNITGLQYDSTGLYLKKITYPDQSFEMPDYDGNTGLLLSNIDVNSQQTSYAYDSMRRLTGVNYPDGGTEGLSYVDTIGSLSVTFSKSITASTFLEKTALADGLGRLTQTQLTSDPNGTDYVDTTYDALGRVASVSNPYRSKSEVTYGVTTYTYDSLSRKVIVTAPDSTKKQACFNGIATAGQSNCNRNQLGNIGAWEDDADENGNDWQRTQNAIGQMTHVFEPSGTTAGPAMETDYYYDMLNNLLSVNQWGGSYGASGARAARTFAYDSLSRLLTSSNPETGSQTYNYQPNGPLCAGDVSLPCSRTDARGVTTNYKYDIMNRLFCKSYSGDASGTPSSGYQYGSPTLVGFVGRLVNAWTQSASSGACPTTPPAGFLSKRSIVSYDAMGRVTAEQQYTPANIASGTPYSPQYSYDLAGNLAYSTDGVTPVVQTASVQLPSCSVPAPSWLSPTMLSFANCYDGAGRLQTLAGNWAIAGTSQSLFSAPPSLTTPSYAAFGGLMSATFGNNSAVALNRTYDNRLRITSEWDTGSILANGTSGSATLTITGSEQSK
jgi:YD repeat-containing protein